MAFNTLKMPILQGKTACFTCQSCPKPL